MMRTLMLAMVVGLWLTGCALPTKEQLATADYGPRPENYQEIVKAHFAQQLFDPYSAMYTFEEPKQTWKSALGRGVQFGWIICGTVNAKNRMGGYVGTTPYYATIRDGKVIAGAIGFAPSETAELMNTLRMDAACLKK